MQYRSIKLKYSSGLSLIEVMITLVIVAIIAGMAYPRYQKMIAKSKQTEAKTILRAIYMGQDLYQINYQKYASRLEELDVEIPKDSRYSYSLETDTESNIFKAKARANIDSDPVLDEWQIDQTNTLKNTVNDAIE